MSAPERTSRQNLVVPPRRGNSSVALGAVICGCIGFAMVWSLGVGRGPADHAADVPTTTTAEPETALEHRPLPGDHVDLDRPDAPPFEAAVPSRPPVTDHAVTPAALAVPETPPLTASRPLSRFSGGPTDQSADDDVGAPPGRLALPPDDELGPALDASASADADTAVLPPLGDPEPLDTQTAADAVASGRAVQSTSDEAPASATSHDVESPADLAAADSTPPLPADEATPSSPPAEPLPADAPPAAPPVAADAAAPLVVSAPAQPPRPFTPADAAPQPQPPRQPQHQPPQTAAVPFASAPALVPQLPRGDAAAPAVSPAADRAGQGRPGPLQLEGVQTPQLTVEKRGPREVQVGKPARYEISVRNVGSAVARDVTLRDAVPYGTTLVTTTPPAAPGHAAAGASSDELVWNLGELAPGGQARVVIELVPQTEGEVGSVASVTFRADASVRSKATKPALAIQCTDPKPVLIGRDAGVTITITNPGSGVATGVVLEGFLPENVSHRSGSELEFDVGQLKPGESRPIELVLGTRGPGVHTARFTARADGGIEVQQAVRLEVTAPTLEIEVDMPVRRFLQRPAACTITMVNAGTAPARSVELAAQLPPGMKFVKANNAGWHDERTHRVLWNLEELPPGEAGTVEVVVMPVELGPQKIFAAARSSDGLADQVAHVCDVEGLAALAFDVTDSEDPIEVEGVTEYVVRIGNQGTKAATGVRLAATLLGDLEPVEAQGPVGHRVDNLTVAFEPLAKLAPSEEAVFRIRARGHSAGDHRVQVQITSEDHPTPITKEETTRVYLDR